MGDRDLHSAKIVMQHTDGSETAVEVPVLAGTCGPSALDVRGLFQKAGVFLHDPGFTSTSSCESSITFIDGATSTLMHGGYAIEDLAREASYLEVCFLLLRGELPTEAELQKFQYAIAVTTAPDRSIEPLFEAFPESAHPMAMMISAVGALSGCLHDAHNSESLSLARRDAIAASMIAQMPTVAAMAYKRTIGEPFVDPEPAARMSFSTNFLRMMFGSGASTTAGQQQYEPPPAMVAAMDTIFLLHADHEQNASTSTVRTAGSSGANPYACIAAGLASLWGPLHGGANEAVIKMIEEIGLVSNIPSYLAKAKDPNDRVRLMGFGHRVYKSFDPRAIEMRAMCHKVLDETTASAGASGASAAARLDDFLTIATELERAALADPYFIERGLFPNVDFYSGITLTAIGIPPEMFTVIFAIGRTPGWVAQWKESLCEEGRRICRPRQVYTGRTLRPYVPIDERVRSSLIDAQKVYPSRL
jgi:citrate synthase